ncbi:hypothetical protein [Rhizobium halophytocola]|uniref:Uncharacterized protein n=1 Tax=Rhizobium halophytocola TaxID=735519 RepID=A0ABS4DVX4_9HYPH|nr:hypothetical protein [Rhizobium halophytocola]MBP1849848.1 hypothetical protein [Rhizobium halophytocola]
MVDIASIRMTSAQTLMKVLSENPVETDTSTQDDDDFSPVASSYLLQSFGVGSSEDGSDTSLYDQFAARLGIDASQTTDTADETDAADIDTDDFMQSLKDKLEEMLNTADGKQQAQEMLEALSNGTLTVTDAAAGTTVTAWDGAGDTASADKTATRTTPADWTAFLRSALTRNSDATYLRGETGAYVDSTTGKSAYFGMVGGTYAYITWPQADTAGA